MEQDARLTARGPLRLDAAGRNQRPYAERLVVAEKVRPHAIIEALVVHHHPPVLDAGSPRAPAASKTAGSCMVDPGNWRGQYHDAEKQMDFKLSSFRLIASIF